MKPPDPHAPIFDSCPRRFRRHPGKTTICGGRLEEARTAGGKLAGFWCLNCERHYSSDGQRFGR